MAAPGAKAGSASSAQAVQAERKVTWSKGDSNDAAGNLAASLHEKLTISQGMRPGRLQPDSPGIKAARGSSEGGAEAGQAAQPPQPLTVHIGVADEQGGRDHMEDRHCVIADFHPHGSDPSVPRQFAGVFDGHSSHRGSEHAARRVHEFVAAQPAIKTCTGAASDQDPVIAALKQAFELVDREIVQTAVEGGRRYGTTAVCALRVAGTVYVAHAGDSRAVLCRDGRAIALTRDHKPASVVQERQRIEAQGGQIAYAADRVHSNPEGQRHTLLNMSRALGDPDFKQPRRLVEAEPDVARVELRPRSDAFMVLGRCELLLYRTAVPAGLLYRMAVPAGLLYRAVCCDVCCDLVCSVLYGVCSVLRDLLCSVQRAVLRLAAHRELWSASDGLFDVVSAQEVVETASQALADATAKGGGLSAAVAKAAADKVVTKATKEGTSDNVTALIMLFDWD